MLPCRGFSSSRNKVGACIFRSFSSSNRNLIEKPFLVTTPIFYPTASPHIGHLYTLVLSDIFKRWKLLCGSKAILNTGTDEHGKKVWEAAEKLGVPVKDFCKEKSDMFRELARRINVEHDHFIRTTDPDHRFAVQHFWLQLNRKGYIYQSKYEGWYSVSDEAFYPENGVYHALDPATGRKFMASKETGKEVNWISEVNYHFRLSAFRDKLLEHYRENQQFVVPASRMSEVYSQVVAGLDDLSISRPRDRIKWGIPVPTDESQTIYVWLDALTNYLTKANYPFQIPGEQEAGGWPADIQVVGKDILRFHCIYWPAFLIALDLPLPKHILTHAHWTLGGAKMAKSTGNVVNPFFAIDRFGIDPLRYYMAYDGGIQDDADYENAYVTERYKKGLFGGLGNLASRVLRSNRWSVEQAIRSAENIRQFRGEWKAFLKISRQHRKRLITLPERVAEAFEALDCGKALRSIMDVVFETNAYIQQAEPWKSASTRPQTDEVIYHCAESLRICGILLQPFMPASMARLLDMLDVDANARSFAAAKLDSNALYARKEAVKRAFAEPPMDGRKRYTDVLFPPLTIDFH